MDQDDPEKRIAELEHQLAEARAAAREDRVVEQPSQVFEAQAGAGQDAVDEHARRYASALWEGLRTGGTSGPGGPSEPEMTRLREALMRAAADAGMSQAQIDDALQHGSVTIKTGHSVVYPRQGSPQDFGAPAGVGPRQLGFPAAPVPVDSRLAPAPRRIPAAFWVAELLPFRWWYIWILFMVAVAPIALWIASPAAAAVGAVLTLLGIYCWQFRGTARRFALLKWGQVAQVTGTQILSRGTYYSGTTLHNVVMPVAHGWKVERPLHSGPSTKTLIRYTVNGSPGELVVRGREYYDGVVLADPRKPARALCVTSFPYNLDRDESGNWIGRLRPRLMLGIAVWLILVIGWLALTAVVAVAAKNGTTFTLPHSNNFGPGRRW